jgi:hypothetical protein
MVAGIVLVLSVSPAGLSSVALGQDPFGALVNRVPRSANAVVILNVEKILSSPVAVQEGWRDDMAKSFESGLIRVPPQAVRFVLGAEIDLEFMEPKWEVALADMAVDWSTEEVMKRRGGTPDTVGGLPAVALPEDIYVVQFASRTLGAMAPANRQAVYRWLRELQSNQPLSPYLERAAGFSFRASTDIIMAIDLEGAVNPQRIQENVNNSDLPSKTGLTAEELTKVLEGVRGVRLGINIGARPVAALAVDFRDPVPFSPDQAKALVLEVLAEKGMSISDIESWKASVSEKRTFITIQGYLSDSGLRRVLSVIDSHAPEEPQTAQPEQPEQPEQPASPGEHPSKVIASSVKYFQTIDTLLSDLKQDMKKVANINGIAVWFDRYADKIDRMPILNVDKDLVNFGAYVATQLRGASGSVRMMGIRGRARTMTITDAGGYNYAYRYGGGPWGGWGGQAYWKNPRAEMSNWIQEGVAIRSQERAGMAVDVQTIRANLIQATADARRQMTERYQVEF